MSTTDTRHVSKEGARKLVHMSFGIFAFSLVWLTTIQAAIIAVCALLFNRFVLPRFGGKQIARQKSGWDTGIIVYPIAVFFLIVAFHGRLWLAAAVWCILAFGDGLATLVGRNLPLSRLPWNREKSLGGSLAFLAAGGAMAWLALLYVGSNELPDIPPPYLLAIGATIVCAIVESLPIGVDDNISVPLAGGLSIFLLAGTTRLPQPSWGVTEIVWLVVNALLALAAWRAKSVNLSGLLGGLLLGSAIILFSGWRLYILLCLFFVIGSGVTKLGYRRKSERGLAQEEGGRRGFSHAFSNAGVASILALVAAGSPDHFTLLWIAAAASLATAAADTAASELGQLYGERAFLPLTLKPMPPGTEGAISLEGTFGGVTAGALVSAVAAIVSSPLGYPPLLIFAIILGAAVAGSWIESVMGSLNRLRGSVVSNGALNFFNTTVGAAIAYLLSSWLL